MNAKYICIFAFLGIFFAQSINALPHDIERSLIDDLVEQIKKFVSNIIQQSNDVIESLKKKLKEALENLKPILDKIKQSASTIVQAAIDKIEEYVKKAQEVNADIHECIQNEGSDINRAWNDFVQGAENCVASEVAAGQELIEKDQEIFQPDWDNCKKAMNNMTQCTQSGNVIDKILCLRNVISQFISTEKDFPEKATSVVAENGKWLIGLPARVEICGTNQLKQTTDAVEKIASDCIHCIQDKIDQTTKPSRLWMRF